MAWLLLLAGCGAPVSQAGPVSDAVAQRAAGTWRGGLDVGGGNTLQLVVHLERRDGAFVGTMDSPDQGATGIPVEAVAPTEQGLAFEVSKIGGRYRGEWTDDGALRGTWSQGPSSLPLDLSKGDAPPPKRARPQDPVPPLPYTEREVRVPSVDGVTLAGTLTLPPGPGPHPAVVLVTGSGPHDRDESLMGHRPFLVLADALARAGVAVLRCDDRGVGGSTGDFAAATTHDFAVDAAAALRHVAALEEIDAERVGILGHSEGGYVAPLAAGSAPVAFVVLVAGPGLTGRGVLESQVEAFNRASGQSDATAKQSRASQARILEVIARDGTADELRAAMEAIGLPPAQIAQSVPAMTSDWYRAFVKHDPAPSLAALHVPVLALIGEKDTQVVPGENGPVLERALADNPDATVEVLPGLNHLLQPSVTGLVDEYGAIETTIDPAALAKIVDWVRSRAIR
jgi:uncharacterized protein